MNFIGMDVSLNSTAIYVQSGRISKIISFTNKKDSNVYIKELESFGVEFHFLYKEKSDDYSDNEMLKIDHFDFLSSAIIESIKNAIDDSMRTYCLIEGYSYSKNTSSILDIVALSTLIKSKFVKIANSHMSIIAPSSLKKEACGMVYGFDKKGNTRNDDGVAGGKFKKPEMFKCVLDGNIDTPILPMLRTYSHLMERSKIPNPIEDIIDATFACKVLSIRHGMKIEQPL